MLFASNRMLHLVLNKLPQQNATLLHFCWTHKLFDVRLTRLLHFLESVAAPLAAQVAALGEILPCLLRILCHSKTNPIIISEVGTAGRVASITSLGKENCCWVPVEGQEVVPFSERLMGGL